MIRKGKSISPGKASGTVRVIDGEAVLLLAEDIETHGSPTWELERLHAAVSRACVQLDRTKRQLGRRVGPADVAIFDTHAGALRDSKFIGQIEQEIEGNGRSAEAGVAVVAGRFYSLFAENPAAFVRDKAADILDIGRRLIRCLSTPPEGQEDMYKDGVIVAREITPSELVRFAHQGVKAIITENCGPNSHTAILARGLGIPMVTGVNLASQTIPEGAPATVDGCAGYVFLGDENEGAAAALALVEGPPVSLSPGTQPSGPAVTADGVRVSLLLNVSDPAESAAVHELGADGIGLLRTEFLYMDRPRWPSEGECYEQYQSIATQVTEGELNIRLADFGAEKCPLYADFPINRNPSLGLRGLRLLLQRDDILQPQVRAILRLARERPITLLLPMLDSVDTLVVATERLCRIAGCHTREELPFRLGAMIEVPSAALMIEEIIDHVDYVATGLNDLTQYTMAADRDDEFVEAYHDPMQPAVLRLLRQVILAAKARSKPVTACGEAAGDPEMTGLLLALGIRRLSVSRSNYLRVLSTLRVTHLKPLEKLAPQIVGLGSARAVRQFVAEHMVIVPAGAHAS